MFYYSLNEQSPAVDFTEATLHGLAPDKGLYFPERLPVVDPSLISNIENLSNAEIAFKVMLPYVGNAIDAEKLYDIVSDTVSFPIPLERVHEKIFSLELFHGPTHAFKDIGARFMSRCLSFFIEKGAVRNKKVVVLVATSGDTGGAVADGFYKQEGIEVVILYPSGKVSPVQEAQLTALGNNIHALEIKGSFDDCQAMVKQAFNDITLKEKLFLTSANSINVARWLPQQFYYFFAYRQWKQKDKPPVISVPSGNFGNLAAGLLACCSGLPVQHFVAACNANDVFVRFLASGNYAPEAVKHTYSNAMDVGDPSNISRVLALFAKGPGHIREMITAIDISDEETLQTIKYVSTQFKYILDPHGAVGYLALEKYLSTQPDLKGLFLETAHPVKFPGVVEKAIGEKIQMPPHLASLLLQPKRSTILETGYTGLKDYLVQFS